MRESCKKTHVSFHLCTIQLNKPNNIMLNWSLTFLVIALIAAFLGFGGIAGSAAGIAQILFGLFILLFILSFIFRGRRPR